MTATMPTRAIGATGLQVSTLGFGTMAIGGQYTAIVLAGMKKPTEVFQNVAWLAHSVLAALWDALAADSNVVCLGAE